jgi:hypothetical protein
MALFVGLTDDDAKICDQGGADCHPLGSGVVLDAGTEVSVAGIRSDRDCQVTAAFISEDESVYLPASSATVAAGGPPYVWTFTWDEVPALGCNAILRVTELCKDGFGSTLNYIIHVVLDADADAPCAETA